LKHAFFITFVTNNVHISYFYNTSTVQYYTYYYKPKFNCVFEQTVSVVIWWLT